MKRPLQAILIAGESQRDEVLANKKSITIRTGHRDYKQGTVILCCHLINWATMRNITDVRMTTLQNVTEQEWLDDGFESQSEMVTELRKYYPDITLDSDVTVVRWNNKID